MASTKLILSSPLPGWSAPLEEVPDAVFAGRMMGDGVAIDPTGSCLHAPCDGTLIVVAPTKHAVTLRAGNGAEILLHVGIDTVSLAGAGFELHVHEGDRVKAGDPLISFDLDLLAQRASSLMTPVVVTHPGGFPIARRSQDRLLDVGDFLMEIQPSMEDVSVRAELMPAPVSKLERRVAVSLEHGIHARPAASLAAAIKSLTAEVTVRFAERRANARSPVSLMALGVRNGDQIVIEAVGADAESAAATVERIVAGRGRVQASASGPASAPKPGPTPARQSVFDTGAPAPLTNRALKGVVASRGLGVGPAFQFSRSTLAVAEPGSGVDIEIAALARALDSVRLELQHSLSEAHSATREISEAHLGLLDDPELVSGAHDLIEAGKSAGYAWRTVMRASVESLRALEDRRMAERVDDLLDLETRVLSALSGRVPGPPEIPPQSILIAQDLLPSELAALDGRAPAGICLSAGGATSHVAIIAAALDIPTLVAAGSGALRVATGTPIVLDAEAGWMYIDPPRMDVERVQSQIAERRSRRAAEQLAAQRECRMADGARIEIFANIGSEAEAHAAIRSGAEGCGLLRTEFLFLDRPAPPDESEQLAQYQRIADALKERPLTIRTLDVGGDKPIPYLPLPREDNPALGLRGVRTSLRRSDLLQAQLRAILRVQPPRQCRILLPMITDAGEIRAVRRMLDGVRAEQGLRDPILLGAMIETPSSALMADRIASEADFLSVGTNDLTQYTLAMDRGHPELAPRVDALHPAVLKLIARAVEAARSHGRMAAVCGGLASDPVAVPILIGLGVHELSVVPAAIPELKALIASLYLQDCKVLARSALEQETAEEVRSLTLGAVSGLDPTGRARE